MARAWRRAGGSRWARAAGAASWAGSAAACALLLLAAGAARCASLDVRDAAGNRWRAVSDPADGAQGYLLERLGANGRPDPRFGREGRRPLAISATDDAPAALRVDDQGRVWTTGASIAGGQPQAVILRFLADGSADLHWGVQGRVQVSPGGLAIKPNDLLPLSDGSVLVAGVAANVEPVRAVVFHLRRDGTIDTSFGTAGLWQRAGATDGSTATNLAAADDGAVAVCVAARGDHPVAEIWTIASAAQKLVHQQALDPASDGEDLRVAWSGGQWSLATGNGPTVAGLHATLEATASAPDARRTSPASAAADPGQGGFSPFAADDRQAPLPAASDAGEERPAAAGPAWAPWTAVLVAAGVAGAAALRVRGRRGRVVPGRRGSDRGRSPVRRRPGRVVRRADDGDTARPRARA